MTTIHAENRECPRAQYFMLNADDGEQVALFVFRPENEPNAAPALVVNMSLTGVQVLVANTQHLSQSAYELEPKPTQAMGLVHRFRMRLVWTKPEGVYNKCGFQFEGDADANAAMAELLAQSNHRLLRCVLHPLD